MFLPSSHMTHRSPSSSSPTFPIQSYYNRSCAGMAVAAEDWWLPHTVRIKRIWFLVPPTELEQYLQSVPKVTDAAVIPMKSKLAMVKVRLGTILVATMLLLQLRLVRKETGEVALSGGRTNEGDN
ncbi:hypothetical protein Tco_1217979 [Tanacetum coccineum]